MDLSLALVVSATVCVSAVYLPFQEPLICLIQGLSTKLGDQVPQRSLGLQQQQSNSVARVVLPIPISKAWPLPPFSRPACLHTSSWTLVLSVGTHIIIRKRQSESLWSPQTFTVQ